MTIKKKIQIKSLKNLSSLYFESISIRASTPVSFAILVKKLGLYEHNSIIDIDSVFIEEKIDSIPLFVEELLLHQRYI